MFMHYFVIPDSSLLKAAPQSLVGSNSGRFMLARMCKFRLTVHAYRVKPLYISRVTLASLNLWHSSGTKVFNWLCGKNGVCCCINWKNQNNYFFNTLVGDSLICMIPL